MMKMTVLSMLLIMVILDLAIVNMLNIKGIEAARRYQRRNREIQRLHDRLEGLKKMNIDSRHGENSRMRNRRGAVINRTY